MEKFNSRKTILVVEDDNMMRRTLVSLLKSEGYDVIDALGGHQALEILANEPIDLIVSDVQMPDGDGFLLANELRSLSLHLPLIFMSGGVVLTDLELKDLGASHFLSKPVSKHDLMNAIHSAFDEAA